MSLQLYLTKPDYDESLFERILWNDRERGMSSEEEYKKVYQSNSGALVSNISKKCAIVLPQGLAIDQEHSISHNARTPTRHGFLFLRKLMPKPTATTRPSRAGSVEKASRISRAA